MIIKIRYPYNPSSRKTIQTFVYECDNYRVDTINKEDTPEYFDEYFGNSDTINYRLPLGLITNIDSERLNKSKYAVLLHMFSGREEVSMPLLLLDCEVWVMNSQGETVDKIFANYIN